MQSPRFNAKALSPDGVKGLLALEKFLANCSLEHALIDLVKLRASQVNGCAYCIDMHWKDLRAAGEDEQRLYGLDAWREAPYYTDRERAALEWTEEVTLVTKGNVSEGVYENVRRQFEPRELSDLTLAVAAINAWNRIAIASRAEAGKYKAKSAAAAMASATPGL